MELDAFAERSRWVIEPEMALCQLFACKVADKVAPCFWEDAGSRLIWDPHASKDGHSALARLVIDQDRCLHSLPQIIARALVGMPEAMKSRYLNVYPESHPPQALWMWCAMPEAAPDMNLVNPLLDALDRGDLSSGEQARVIHQLTEAGVCEIPRGRSAHDIYHLIEGRREVPYMALKVRRRGWLVRGTVVRRLVLG